MGETLKRRASTKARGHREIPGQPELPGLEKRIAWGQVPKAKGAGRWAQQPLFEGLVKAAENETVKIFERREGINSANAVNARIRLLEGKDGTPPTVLDAWKEERKKTGDELQALRNLFLYAQKNRLIHRTQMKKPWTRLRALRESAAYKDTSGRSGLYNKMNVPLEQVFEFELFKEMTAMKITDMGVHGHMYHIAVKNAIKRTIEALKRRAPEQETQAQGLRNTG